MGSSAGMSKAHACGTPRDGQPDPSFYPTGIERFPAVECAAQRMKREASRPKLRLLSHLPSSFNRRLQASRSRAGENSGASFAHRDRSSARNFPSVSAWMKSRVSSFVLPTLK